MKIENAKEVIRNSFGNVERYLGWDYIEAQLKVDWLRGVNLQVGPNCNLNCSHCYGNFGTKRRGLPKKDLVLKLLSDIAKANIDRLDQIGEFSIEKFTVTDGEPLREENRETMGLIAYSSEMFEEFSIITNGMFGRTPEEAREWLSFLKERGLKMEGNRRIAVSAGQTYEVPPENYSNINQAMREVFPESDLGFSLAYYFLMIGNSADRILLQKLQRRISQDFPSSNSRWKKGGNEFTRYLEYKEEGEERGIRIYLNPCSPLGNALDIPEVRKKNPKKSQRLEEIDFFPDVETKLWVSSTGKVSFGGSWNCVRPAKIYGDITPEPLSEIKERISTDTIYQAYRLGGARFLLYLARETNPEFLHFFRTKCDICHGIFSDRKLVEKMREGLEQRGVVQSYKEFLESFGEW